MKAGPGHDTVPYFVIKMLIQFLPFHGGGAQALPSKLDLKAFNSILTAGAALAAFS